MDMRLTCGQPYLFLLFGHGLILLRHILDAWNSVLLHPGQGTESGRVGEDENGWLDGPFTRLG